MGWKEKDQQNRRSTVVVPSWWLCASNRGSSVPVWTTRKAWQAVLKTFRQQVGVQGKENRKIPSLWSGWRKVMMLHVMFRSDRKTYGCNILGSEWESYGWTSLQYGCYMDHVLWEGLYADRVRTNWCFGTKDQTCPTRNDRVLQVRCNTSKVNALRFTLVMKRKHEG